VTVKAEHNIHKGPGGLQNDSAAQVKHRELEVGKFYQYLDKIRYSALFARAATTLALFGSTCEQLFSNMKMNRSGRTFGFSFKDKFQANTCC
jgi:hypothetical protein